MKDKFLSLEWFKSKVEESTERIIERKLDKILDKLVNDDEEKDVNQIKVEFETVSSKKLYQRLTLHGDVLTVIFEDGSIISKSNATKKDWQKVKDAKTQKELYEIVASKEIKAKKREEEKEIKKNKAFKKGISLLTSTGEFTSKDGSVYLQGISRSLPQLLVEKFIEVVYAIQEETSLPINEALEQDDEFLSLKRFFMWCCLNPRAEVANDLYDFLAKNSFRITKQGFFVALRNVVTINTGDSTEIVQFISNAYNKVKAVWKKNPKDYWVINDKSGNYALTGVDPKDGSKTLYEMYLDLPNMTQNRFTDAHTRTFDIRVGQVVNMPSEKCNWNRADCGSAGLHFTSDEIHYVGCGDTSVLVLINPMKVVGIGTSKGRCYEYLPIMTVPRKEATEILHDGEFDTLQLDDLYAIDELKNLKDKAQEGFVIETTKHQFNLPSISLDEISDIVKSLNSMKEEIKNRVKNIK